MTVFIERGYEAASMAEVAAQASCSKQTLYSYFSSKDDLFVAVMLEKGAALADPAFIVLDEDRDLKDALREFSIRFLRFITSPEALAIRRIVYAEGARSNLGKLFYEHGPKKGYVRMAEHLAHAMDKGQIRRSDPWIAAQQFYALCEAGPVQNLLEGAVKAVTDEDLLKAATTATDVFIRAYHPT
ncbi:TetR/AcrR family transcriptional regulator [Asticcacaulis sp. MM231]|uniref:TetR/AcrR family transcriptional regulator n=1 Tax=Asticcacaulis sp. MM231 TaxID=3157666 RepID=UPI0032D5817E